MWSHLMIGFIGIITNSFCDDATLQAELVAKAKSLIVTVKQGSLQGKQFDLVTKDGTYYGFKGIPYAKPPVGSLRFKAPEAPENWTGIRNASEHGAKCAQKFINTVVSTSEDCLFLNVYTKNLTPKTKKPVIVFIHGGGYRMYSGNADNFGPDFLVQHGVVVVTINFRLGIFGFLSLGSKAVPGNAAMKDQVLALKWVKENIAAFGGDPNNVTIMGQSSGGAAVGHHMASPMSAGLFHRAIIMSGTPIDDWNLSYDSARRGFDVGKKLGYYTRDADQLLSYLQNATVLDLLNVVPDVLGIETLTSYFFKYFQFVPVIEKDLGQERFIVEDPTETFMNDNFVSEVDVLIGYTDEEGAIGAGVFPSYFANFDYYPELLPPRRVTLRCNPDTVLDISDTIREFYFGEQQISNKTMQQFIDYCGDSGFVHATNRFANDYSDLTDKSVYFYVFSGYTERNVYGQVAVPWGVKAAAHSDDLQYLFNPERFNLTITKGTDAYTLVNNTCTVFTNFAKHGNPTPNAKTFGVTWPQYTAETRQYVDINTKLTIKNNPFAESYEFWEDIYATVEEFC